MGPLYFLSSGHWRNRFRDALRRRNVIYTSLPGDEAGTATNGTTWYRRYGATVRAVMASVALVLVSLLVWSVFADGLGLRNNQPAACDTPEHGYRCRPRISHQWGQYSPFFAVTSEITPELPTQCTLNFAQILSRHGARAPTFTKSILYRALVARIQAETTSYGRGYEFLKHYQYSLGSDELTPFGEQEMSNSGAKFYSRYRSLVHQTPPSIRASGQPRVIHSAEQFAQGFHNALTAAADTSTPPPFPYDILIIPEQPGANNTLNNKLCTAFTTGRYSQIGTKAASVFLDKFAPRIADRLNANLPGANLSSVEVPLLMDLCPYQTVASLGGKTISTFCDLFTPDEWAQYDYYQALGKWYGFGPGNPLGPTQGVGWVNELLARLTGKAVEDNTSTNRTLDGDETTFPLGRKLYADFSHDNDMMTVLGALGVYEDVVMDNSTMKGPEGNGGFSASWAVPFAARVYVERITCGKGGGNREEWVRVLVNDRVMPLKRCGSDALGMCRLDRFVEGLEFARKGGRWDLCFG